jgi:predicted RNase H-like HicB family nuclease
MAQDIHRTYDKFALAISEEENPEKLEELLDELLRVLAERSRPIPVPEERKTVHSVIRTWRFV